MRCTSWIVALAAMRLALPSTVIGQATSRPSLAEGLSPQVREFVALAEPLVVLTHVDVIDGTGRPVQRGQTIVLDGGRIAAVGPTGSIAVPEGARVVDLSGSTVLPGFVMLHEHMFYPAGGRAYNQQEFSFPRLYLAGGATTIRTGGSRDPFGDLNLKKAVDDGRRPGPRIHVTGPYLNGPGLPILFVNTLDGVEDARRFVRYWAAEGVTSFKAYMHISRAELGAAIEEAHRLGIKVTGHLCSVTYREAADLGIDNLEHGLMASTDFVRDKEPDVCPSAARRSLLELDPNGPEARELIDHLIEKGVALTSTLTVFETRVRGQPRAPDGALDAMSPAAREQYLDVWNRVATGDDETAVAVFRNALAFEKAFAEAGGLLVAGTDPTGYGGVVAGYANLREVELLVQAGFTAEQAVEVATRNGARYLEMEEELGTVEPGRIADLVVVDGDPARDIAQIRNVRWVFKGGVAYDSERLFASVKGVVGVR